MRQFLPFGRRVDFIAPIPRSICIERLRTHVTPIDKRPFDARLRGFMLASRGLFWLHALDLIDRQSRPKLYIRLIDQGGTTRIRGRMLPGITGPIAIVAMTPFALAWMVGMAFREPGYRVADPFGLVLARILLILAVLLSVGALWWLLGRSQREGRPIENAVRRALGISTPASRE